MIELSSLDSNAVPFLIQALKKHDGLLRRAYNRLWYRLPGWLQRDVPPPKTAWLIRTNADLLLGEVGAGARAAIPDLIRVMREDDSPGPRAYAAAALGNIANSGDSSVVAALVVVINDPGPNVRRLGRKALMRIDPDIAAQVGVQ